MAIDKIWDNMVSKKLYINGGIGAIHNGERFGDNYELPNLTAYNETCAAIANVYWNYRMFLLHGDAKYMDVLERSLYNNVIAGVGMDGITFFYTNPLACDTRFKFNNGSVNRQPWFDCSCCPTNLCRFLPSVPGYIYAQKQNTIFINLFIGSNTTIKLNEEIEVHQHTNYPWDGNVRISISPSKKDTFTVKLRVPGWVRNKPVPSDLYTYINPDNENIRITINGKITDYRFENGYAIIERAWDPGDEIEYDLPLRIHRVEANQNVEEDHNKVALERGPILYCLEGTDNPDIYENMELLDQSELVGSFDNTRNHGIGVIKGEGVVFGPSSDKQSIQSVKRTFVAIPYFAWCNRGITHMQVWIPRTISQIHLQ